MYDDNNQISSGQAIVKSIWLTRKESVTLEIDDKTITREISIGLTVSPEGNITYNNLYKSAAIALTRLVEEEKESWLERNAMGKEINSFTSKITNNNKENT